MAVPLPQNGGDDDEADDENENAVVMMLMMKLTMVVMMMVLLVTECMGWSSDVCTRTVPPPIHWSGQSEVAEHETFTRKIKKNQKR